MSRPTNDDMPLFSSTHLKTSDEWDFKIPYIGRMNKFFDWVYLRFHKVRLTGSNFEKLI